MTKPTGTSGSFHVQINPDGSASGSFVPVTFSKSKSEIEQQVADQFIKSMDAHPVQEKEKFFLSAPRLNQENDFDFTVDSPQGEASLELMEIAPLKGSYKDAPTPYNVYDFSKTIFQGILSKSQSYPQKMAKDLFLLVYVTHWSFTLSKLVIACLRYWCASTPLAFRAIFYYAPRGNSGLHDQIYPVSSEILNDFDPEKVRAEFCLNLDPRTWYVQGKGSA